LFVVFFVLLVVEGEVRFGVVVFVDFYGGSRLGEVEAVRAGLYVADDSGGIGLADEPGGVVGGQLEAIEQGGGAAGVQIAGGEGVDDDGEGDLDGFSVFEGIELDVLAGNEVAAGGVVVAEALVGLVEAGVEVAPEFPGEGWGLAAGAVGLDVATERELHGRPPGGYPPYYRRVSHFVFMEIAAA
jgi:hypothetical protein